jgi:hypothetical protein
MKTVSSKRLSALLLAIVFTSVTPALRAQFVSWHIQSFDGNVCGLNPLSAVTLTYDPTQDDTGDGGGSCHVATYYSPGGSLLFIADNEACCFCLSEIRLELSNYDTVEFDVKWDNSSPVPLSYFNFRTNSGTGSPGITGAIAGGQSNTLAICTAIIPDAATNGWVHVSAAIDHSAGNFPFSALMFDKTFPANATSNTAAFWMDNLALAGPPAVSATPQSCTGGTFTLQTAAIKGKTYTILKSADLINWTDLVTGYPAGGAVSNTMLSITDTNASASHGYYRVRSP